MVLGRKAESIRFHSVNPWGASDPSLRLLPRAGCGWVRFLAQSWVTPVDAVSAPGVVGGVCVWV